MIPLHESKYEKYAKRIAEDAASRIFEHSDDDFDASAFLISKLRGSGFNEEECRRIVERFNVNLFKVLYRNHVPDNENAGDMTYPLADPERVVAGVDPMSDGVESQPIDAEEEPPETDMLSEMLLGDKKLGLRYMDIYRDHIEPSYPQDKAQASLDFESWLLGDNSWDNITPNKGIDHPERRSNVITVDEALGDLIRNMRVYGIGQSIVRQRARVMFEDEDVWPRMNIALSLTPELKISNHVDGLPKEIIVNLDRLAEAIKRSSNTPGFNEGCVGCF